MPGPVIEADRRDAALVEACRQVRLDPAGAELLRRGTNSVYRLRSAPVIVRVAPQQAPSVEIQRQVAVARWLAREGLPSVRALDVDQPVLAEGQLVTLWESLSEGSADDLGQYGTTVELGDILRRLHSLPPPPDLELPRQNSFERIEDRLSRLDHLEEADRIFLVDHVASLQSRLHQVRYVLPQGPIHGDANVGNLLRDRAGQAVLIDLDTFQSGPREWDLLQTAIFYDRFGWHTEAEYEAFVDSYGYDLREWDGYPVLGDVRELSMVLWVASNAATSEEAAAELLVRLESLRTGEGRDRWKPL